MDYEKAYKEVLERAKEIERKYSHATDTYKEIIKMFPELKEDEDEQNQELTYEKKELLLKDLCARLPYGVMLHIEGTKPLNDFEHITEGIVGGFIYNKLQDYTLEDIYEALDTDCNIQMYLRPMSSMTEDETYSWLNIIHHYNKEGNPCIASIESYDWLNQHHFDYRGLIEKGLALPAPEGMYD